MRLEFLLQFIVPLTFLAIWALTSLLNRDAQPLPPRPGTGRGPAPGSGPARGTVGGGYSPSSRGDLTRSSAASPARPSPSMADRTAPARWSSAPAAARPGSVPTRAVDEGIVIIDSESRGAQGSSSFSPSSAAGSRAGRATGPAARKAVSRARSTPAVPMKPIEPERPRALTGLVGQPLGQKRGKPLEIVPLSSPMAPISSAPLTSSSQTPAAEVARSAAQPDVPSLSIDELRAMLASPKRLREVALLGELLQPPVSLRGHRRPR